MICNCRAPNSPLDYEEACLTARYLAANRPFSQSFDIYLSQVLLILSLLYLNVNLISSLNEIFCLQLFHFIQHCYRS